MSKKDSTGTADIKLGLSTAREANLSAHRSKSAYIKPSDIAAFFEDTTEIMAQGLIVFDDKQILFANSRVSELLSLPDYLFEPGRPWVDFLLYSIERGDYGLDITASEIFAHFEEKIVNADAMCLIENYPTNDTLKSMRYLGLAAD